jgi:hypothetical protein
VAGSELAISPVCGAITVDGTLDEWDEEQAKFLSLYQGSAGEGKGAFDDNKAKVALQYDKAALYLAVWWTDPTPLGPQATPGAVPPSDGVILSLPLQTMQHLALWKSPGAPTTNAVLSTGDVPLAKGNALPGVTQGYQVTGNASYPQEARIPWVALGGQPTAGMLRLAVELCFGGLAVDKEGKLWVTEDDNYPRRISVWDAGSGKFLKEFIGGTTYGAGCGGMIDPKQPNCAISLGMLFEIDLAKEGYRPLTTMWRRTSREAGFGFGPTEAANAGPVTRYLDVPGRRLIVTTAWGAIIIGELRADGTWLPRAAVGGIFNRGDNPQVVPEAKLSWRQDLVATALSGHGGDNYVWTDLNGDGLVQADEMQWRKQTPDFPLLGQYWGAGVVDGQMNVIIGGTAIMRFPFQGWTANGAPKYDITTAAVIVLSHGKNAHHLMQVTGLETVKRFQGTFTLTPANAALAVERLATSQTHKSQTAPLRIVNRKDAVTVDGKLDEWNWKSAAAIGPSEGQPRAEMAMSTDGKMLFLAYKVTKGRPFLNTGQELTQLFLTGDAVDLQFCADPVADPKRTAPIIGDCRLLISKLGEKPVAVLYRAQVPFAKSPVAFRSPARTVTFDEVSAVKDAQIVIQDTADGYLVEAAVPMRAIVTNFFWPGRILQGDAGIIVADTTGRRVARIYRFNTQTTIVNDVPSEAILTPNQWGEIEVDRQ